MMIMIFDYTPGEGPTRCYNREGGGFADGVLEGGYTARARRKLLYSHVSTGLIGSRRYMLVMVGDDGVRQSVHRQFEPNVALCR